MKVVATINHNDENRRINLELDQNLNLFCEGQKLEAPQFETQEEVKSYIKGVWGSSVWDLELV